MSVLLRSTLANGERRACWYRRRVAVPPLAPGERLRLHFSAVDHAAEVWAAGLLVARHEGRYKTFFADLSDYRDMAEVDVVIRAADPHDLPSRAASRTGNCGRTPAGYPRTTGIWQSVWLERLPETVIGRPRWTPALECWEVWTHQGQGHVPALGEQRGLPLVPPDPAGFAAALADEVRVHVREQPVAVRQVGEPDGLEDDRGGTPRPPASTRRAA